MRRVRDVWLRFWDKVQKATIDGCWLWTASRTIEGYGKLRVGDASALAHRMSYELARGPVPAGMVLDHLCRVRHCVNPDHLEAVTQRTNTRRGIGPAAVNAHKSTCDHGHPFDDANTYVWNGKRSCRRCKAVVAANYRARKTGGAHASH